MRRLGNIEKPPQQGGFERTSDRYGRTDSTLSQSLCESKRNKSTHAVPDQE